MKKALVLLTAFTLLFSLVPVAMAAFEDAPDSSHWVYEEFMVVYNAGLLKGYPDGTFKGSRYATRYEMVALTARVLKFFESKLDSVKAQNVVTLDEAKVKELIAQALAENGKAVDPAEIDRIYEALTALEKEFKDELAAMDIRVTTLEEEVEALRAEVDALKEIGAASEEATEAAQAAQKDAKTAKILGIIGIVLGVAGCVLP